MHKFILLYFLPALIFSKEFYTPKNIHLKEIELNDSEISYTQKGNIFIEISGSYLPFFFDAERSPFFPCASFSICKQWKDIKSTNTFKEISIEIIPGAGVYLEDGVNNLFRYSSLNEMASCTCYELKYQHLYYFSPKEDFSSYFGGGLALSYPRIIPAYLTYGVEWNRDINPSRLNFCLSFSPIVIIAEANPSHRGSRFFEKYFFSAVTTSFKIGYGYGF